MTKGKLARRVGQSATPEQALVAADAAPANGVRAPRKARAMLKTAMRNKDGQLHIDGGAAELATLEAAFGSDVGEFIGYGLSTLLAITGGTGKENLTQEVNQALALLTAIEPRDELEAALAIQMVATHHLTLASMHRFQSADTIERRKLHGELTTKFSRTFTAQLEALGKHRRGGEQVVRHVHVNEGGQAVIANTVNTGGVR